jgi:predicted amidophosphoribosyltransferase
MTYPVLSLKHLKSDDNLLCSGCGAEFVPSEDSGSRQLGLRGDDLSFAALLCGGCHSKWSHGTPLTLKGPLSA